MEQNKIPNRLLIIGNGFDLEGELATYVNKLNDQHLSSYRSTISNIAKKDEHDFKIIVEEMISYLSFIEKHTTPKEPSFEYVHGCLTNHSAILGVNDSVDTIDFFDGIQ